MKLRSFLLVFLLVTLAAAGGYYVAVRTRAQAPADSAAAGRKILYYQSSMHPWIKAERPGNCTICGMRLTPVYEGEKGFAVDEKLITLSSNIVNVLHVETSTAQRQPLMHTLRVAGVIEDDDTRHRILAAYVDGRIDQLFVNYVGAEVVAGQPLAMFYSPMLLTAEREFISLQRQQGKSPGLQAGHNALLDAARLRLVQFGLNQKQIEALPDKQSTNIHTELLAPMSGTVVARHVYAGQYVKEGDPLFEIADFSTMWFLFDAYERDLPWLQAGQEVEVRVPALPGRVFRAPITFIDPNIKDPTRSAKARVELENPADAETGRRLLYHKLYAEGRVTAAVPEVLAVPRSAVLSPGGEPVVYVQVDSGTYEQRRVQTGRVGDDLVEIVEGLTPGESVVTTGNLLIDAQAELNRSVAPAGPTVMPATNEFTQLTLSTGQQDALTNFFASLAVLSGALASDDLTAFNTHRPHVATAATALAEALAPHQALGPTAQKISPSLLSSPAADLAAARRAFHPFSSAAAELGLLARRSGAVNVKIFRCPMTDRAFEGAPRTGQWVQLEGPLRNPFFGAEMLDCGTEVKP